MNWILKLAIATVFASFLMACGGGGSASPSVDVTGTWKGTARNSSSGLTESITFNLKQTGSDVVGSLAAPSNVCVKNAVVTGSVSGVDFNGQAIVGDIRVNYKGTVVGNAISGTYEVTSGPCGTGLGTFNVIR
jgi:hypothetical protein